MSTIKPVTIPREVADAIDRLRSSGVENSHITALAIGGGMGPSAHALNEWACAGNFDTLMRALLDEYERELTEEEKREKAYANIREMYCDTLAEGRQTDIAYAAGMEYVLDALGVTIPGINDAEGGTR